MTAPTTCPEAGRTPVPELRRSGLRRSGLRRSGLRRRGFTLIEIAVVMVIMLIIMAVGIPAMSGLLDLQQRAAAKEITQTYLWLIDEASLRNVSFRIAYNLDARTWKVEVGDADTVVFGTPEEREEHDAEVAEDMKRYTDNEVEEGVTDLREDGEASGQVGRFEGLSGESLTTENKLPDGTMFAYIYTPQYGEDGVTPTDDADLDDLDPEDQHVAYTYVFPDGTAEHIVVQIVDEDDPEEGYTIEVQPLSGEVSLLTDIVGPEDSMTWLPTEGPTIR